MHVRVVAHRHRTTDYMTDLRRNGFPRESLWRSGERGGEGNGGQAIVGKAIRLCIVRRTGCAGRLDGVAGATGQFSARSLPTRVAVRIMAVVPGVRCASPVTVAIGG